MPLTQARATSPAPLPSPRAKRVAWARLCITCTWRVESFISQVSIPQPSPTSRDRFKNSINALEIQDCLLLGFDTQLPQDACHLPVQVIKPRLSLQCIFLYLHGPIDPRRLGDTTTMMAVVQLSSIVVPFTLISRIQTGIPQVDPEVFILQCWVGRTSLGPLSLSQVPDMIGFSNIHRCQVELGEITWRKNNRRQSFLAALFSTVRLF